MERVQDDVNPDSSMIIVHTPEKQIPFMGVITHEDGSKSADILNYRTKAHELVPAEKMMEMIITYLF